LPAPLSSPHALPLGPVGELAVQEARVLAELAPAFPLLVPGARPAAALSDELVVLSGSAWESLDVWVRALASSGALVLVEGKALRQASLKRRVKGSQGQSTGLLAPGRLGLSAEVTVGGVAVDPAAADSLMCVDGQWVVMSRGEVAAARGLAAAVKRGVSTADLLLDAAFEGVEIDADVFSLAVAPRRVRVPRGFGASLRPYQRDGLDWLSWLEENGLGGVLADEMGLGKTVQCLARIQADHPGPTLVVAPFSLLSNWVSEAARFTPGLRVGVFHGTSRPKVGDLDVVVTTYQTLARSPLLAAVSWHRVIADEAQTVKNPVTAAHRALRGLTASHRLMVTGTPVENHVGDLHSLASLVMPGLLGPRASFMRKFGAFGADVEVVRAVMEPFMLRRVKADVLKDLPGKSVVTVECALSQEQVSVYEREHASMLEGVGGRAGVARAGAVLSGLLRLKQACVHPSLVPGSPGSGFAARSGKVVELERIVRSALGSGEAVVVFTQFAEVIPALAAHLESVTGQRVVTLDGSMSKRARDASLAAFADPSGPPVLVCSLKTGGVGLNLVRACHVVHLDRWWNPAVEDQASDRVWRIGQLRAVTVHLLVCPGTLEDRIDELLEVKRGAAASVVGRSGRPVTQLSVSELDDLVRLVRHRVL
jgi:SNF2 family DNA or RNA helicase